MRPAPTNSGAARALFAHAWPYHIRELEQCLRAAVAVAPDDEIRLEDLALAAPARSNPDEADDGRERLVGLLRKHAGNISAIARELTTSRTQVQRMVDRYGLAPSEFRRG